MSFAFPKLIILLDCRYDMLTGIRIAVSVHLEVIAVYCLFTQEHCLGWACLGQNKKRFDRRRL